MQKRGPDWQRISQLASAIQEKFPNFDADLEEITEIICKIESNSYQLMTTEDSLNGIFVTASMLNHKCFKANSRPSFGSNHQMKIVATQEIEAGQEISTPYLEPFHTNLQRRAILLRGKSFECSCERCSDPKEFGTFSSCPKCQFCNGNGYLVTLNSLNLGMLLCPA